jgi:hypothetical protein
LTARKVALQRPANVVGLRLQAAPGHIMEYHGLPYETDFSIQRQPPRTPTEHARRAQEPPYSKTAKTQPPTGHPAGRLPGPHPLILAIPRGAVPMAKVLAELLRG